LEFGYLRLNRQIVWLDVDAFAASRTRFEQDSPNGLTSTTARAANHYRGEFLPGEDSAWACPLRGQAQGWYERIVRIHGQSLERSGQPNDAIEWYRAALYAAPLAVGIHGGLIRCLASLGRSLEAVEAYQHYRALSLP
jgi:two-component SAPR family response regulator